jgi:hypothetical protein
MNQWIYSKSSLDNSHNTQRLLPLDYGHMAPVNGILRFLDTFSSRHSTQLTTGLLFFNLKNITPISQGVMDMKTTSVSFNNNSRSLTSTLPTEIVQAYGTLIRKYVDDLGWDGYRVTFMFRNISRSEDRKIEQMHREICRAYQKLATRAVRKPRSEKWAHLLPKGIFFPDVPGYKKSEFKVGEVSVNDGIHMHGVMVVPKQTRLKERLDLHFLRKRKLYVGGKIYRIYAEPITSRAAFVTDYGGKATNEDAFRLITFSFFREQLRNYLPKLLSSVKTRMQKQSKTSNLR